MSRFCSFDRSVFLFFFWFLFFSSLVGFLVGLGKGEEEKEKEKEKGD